MAYKCRKCGVVDVENKNDICPDCSLGVDPVVMGIRKKKVTKRSIIIGNNKTHDIVNRDENVIVNESKNEDNKQRSQNTSKNNTGIHQKSSALRISNATSTKPPICKGIVKNWYEDQPKGLLGKQISLALFKGIPISMDDSITLMQVFPDYSGTAKTATGNACDQVIVYGKINKGALAENNEVEVYGKRDSNGNIIATKIINVASGTIVKPNRTVPAIMLQVAIVALLFTIIINFSRHGSQSIFIILLIAFMAFNFNFTMTVFSKVFKFFFSIIKRLMPF